MGLMDKFKKILFDEDEVEIPIGDDELPERKPKPKKEERVNTTRSGFIDYTDKKEEDEEDTIKEVHVPEEDVSVEKKEHDFSFPIIEDYDNKEEKEDIVPEEKEEEHIPQRRDYASLINTDFKVKKTEEKDYRSIINKRSEEDEVKKPFKVTPVISPVYGYIEEPKAAEMELISVPKKEVDPTKPRMFGPVSFNDEPLPIKKPVIKKEEIKEVSDSIIDLAKEEVKEEIKTEIIEEVNEELNEELNNDALPEEDIVIETPNYDDYEEIQTSGIEEAYLGNNSIEDAFDSTEELKRIDYEDEIKEETPDYTTEEVIEQVEEEQKEETADTDDTIETDLFNLIDSMYTSKNEEEIEED